MSDKKSIWIFLWLLWFGVWLVGSLSPVQGARVTGEEGVTPAAPEARQEVSPRTQSRPAIRSQTKRNRPQLSEKTPPKEAAPKVKEKEEKASDARYVTIDFDNVDIRLFIKFIADLTGKNFVVDKGVKGEVTIISPIKISVEEAYRVFESVMEVHGFTVVPAGKIIKVVPAVEARSKDVELRLREEVGVREDKVVTQLIPLSYADPNALTKLFKPLISKSSVIVPYEPTNMLIVTDVLSNVNRLLRIIKEIDREGIGQEISVIPLKHATAPVLGKSLDALFQRRARKPPTGAAGEPAIRIVPDERTNALVILATADETAMIKALIGLLDKETPKGEGDIHVYYLQNANAEELSKVLTALPSNQRKEAPKGEAPVISKDVQIVADKATNSLVITAKKDDFLVLEDVIGKLDIARRMVYIEALFMEVDTSKDFDLGVEWQVADTVGSYEGKDVAAFGASNTRTPFPLAADGGTVIFPSGLSLGVLGEGITIGNVVFPSIKAIINAFQFDSNIHILSTPQIMTTDNEEAEISVGKNIPFLVRQDTSVTGVDYSNYEYKDVGVTLKITPQINQERFLRLNISQEVSQVIEEESELGLPSTLKRFAKTTVVIKDGHTVVIGGLIDETLNEGYYKVPCLGNMTGLGWLFRSESISGGKSNLFIFLTPHIIENPREAQEVYEKKKEEIDRVKEGVIKLYENRK